VVFVEESIHRWKQAGQGAGEVRGQRGGCRKKAKGALLAVYKLLGAVSHLHYALASGRSFTRFD
jgi:hypothetical protein